MQQGQESHAHVQREHAWLRCDDREDVDHHGRVIEAGEGLYGLHGITSRPDATNHLRGVSTWMGDRREVAVREPSGLCAGV